MRRTISVLMVLTLALFGASAMAGEKAVKQAGEHKTIDGKVVCLGCDLKKGQGARAECTEFGHRHALKTADGKIINLLENKYSADLIKGKYHDKDVNVHGVYFASANVLDVESFTTDGKNKSWCNQCKAMDACSVTEEKETKEN